MLQYKKTKIKDSALVSNVGGSTRLISPFLTGLDNKSCGYLMAKSRMDRYKKGETIHLQGDEADFLFIVDSGCVKLFNLTEDSSEMVFSFINAGQSFGELGILQKSSYEYSAVALSSVTVRKIHRSEIFFVAKEDPSILLSLSELVAHRYRCYIEFTKCLNLNSLTARVSYALLRIFEQDGRASNLNCQPACQIASHITQTDIAQMARCTRSSANRTLKELERVGVLDMRGRSIYLLNRDKLQKIYDANCSG